MLWSALYQYGDGKQSVKPLAGRAYTGSLSNSVVIFSSLIYAQTNEHLLYAEHLLSITGVINCKLAALTLSC